MFILKIKGIPYRASILSTQRSYNDKNTVILGFYSMCFNFGYFKQNFNNLKFIEMI